MTITQAMCDITVYDWDDGDSETDGPLSVSRVDHRIVDVITPGGTYRVSGRDLIAAVEAMLKLGGVR